MFYLYKKNILFLSVGFLFAAFLFSCSNSKRISEQSLQKPLKTQQSQSIEKPEEFSIRAYAKQNKVFIIIKNNMKTEIKISPLDFAIIKDKKLTVYNHENGLCEFPTGILKPGFEFNGWFTFYNLGDLKGHRLVYNNPKYQPIYTIIEDYNQIE